MREQFKDEPALSSAILGAVSLAVAYGIANVIFFRLTTNPNMAKIDGAEIAIASGAFSGACWGWILGGNAGRAWGLFKQGDRGAARKILLKTGAWSMTVHLEWFAFMLSELLPSGLWTQAILRMLMNLCFQCSLLTLLIGFILPRREEDTVQVTETLRL